MSILAGTPTDTDEREPSAGLPGLLGPAWRARDDMTDEERTNLDAFLRYRKVPPAERRRYMTETCTIHRRGIMHLTELAGGAAGSELNHAAMADRSNEVVDVIVEGDRLWSVFTLKARHVGELYGVPASGKQLAITEFCVLRFEEGKIAEGWFFADELGLCRQLGIAIGVGVAGAGASPAASHIGGLDQGGIA